MSTQCVIGGIGDFMLSIDGMKAWSREGNDIIFYTHQSPKTIKDFAELFELNIKDIITFKDVKELIDLFNSLEYPTFAPTTFAKQKLSSEGIWKDNDYRIVLHPKGSQYSRSFLEEANEAPKDIPLHIVEYLICSLNSVALGPIAVVMSPEEWKEVDANGTLNWISNKFIRIDDIKTAIRASATCDLLVGSDSGMKTVSSVFKRKTIVMMPKMYDLVRDQVFLVPYVQAGVMNVFQYTKEQYDSSDAMLNLAIAVTQLANQIKSQ